MEINFDLQNGNILLELKKAIEKEYYLVLTDSSFYSACEKSIGKINIYEPTTLTPKLLKIIIGESLEPSIFVSIEFILGIISFRVSIFLIIL